MRNAFFIGRYFGIDVKVHWSFFLIFVLVLFEHQGNLNTIDILSDVVLILILFFCVTLHEFGHALAGKSYGISTEEIVLLPIGGVAKLHHIPEKATQELWVAFAGPLVNIVIVTILTPFVYYLMPEIVTLNIPNDFWLLLLARVYLSNIVLILFNLLPIFPMDGGRIFRALLVLFKMNRYKATLIAARSGQILAIAGAVAGYYFHWAQYLGITALFIIFGAENELRMVKRNHDKRNMKVGDVLFSEYATFNASQTINDALKVIAQTGKRDFVVTKGYEPIGIFTAENIVPFINSDMITNTLETIMQKDFITVNKSDPFEEVLQKLINSNNPFLTVMDGSYLVGILPKRIIVEG